MNDVVSQTGHPRVTIPGRFEGGGPCTLLLVQAPDGMWRLYLTGAELPPVLVADPDLKEGAREVLGKGVTHDQI